MSIKLNGATSGSVELDVPADIGSDLSVTIPATAGDIVVKGTDGSVDLGDVNIDSSGNVGIGSTEPARQFTVYNSSAPIIQLVNSTTGQTANDGLLLYESGSNFVIENQEAGEIQIYNNGSQRATIDSSGRLLVGTSSGTLSNASVVIRGNPAASGVDGTIQLSRDSLPNATTSGVGGIYFTDNSSNFGASIAGIADAAWTSGSSHPTRLVFSTTASGASSPTERLRITNQGRFYVPGVWNFSTSGGTTVVVTSDNQIRKAASSIKYKTDVEELQDSYADQILNIRPVWYRSLCDGDDPNHSYWGFIAEEVAEIDPRLTTWKFHNVSYDENGSRVVTKLDNPEPEGVAYDRFVPHLLNLIKRQNARIEALEAEVTALKGGAS